MQNVDTRVEGKHEISKEDDVEFIQIPEHQEPRVESLSETSSTCSFDVIDENKRKTLLDNEKDPIDIADDCDSDDDETFLALNADLKVRGILLCKVRGILLVHSVHLKKRKLLHICCSQLL